MKDETNGTGLRLLNGPAADRWAVNCFLGGAMLYFVCALYSHTLLPQQNALQAPVQLLYLCAVALLVGKILLFTRYTRPQLAAVVLIVGVWLASQWGHFAFSEEPLAVLVLLAAKDAPLHRVVRPYLAITAVGLAITAGLAVAGVLPMTIAGVDREGVLRPAFGFYHPNTLAATVLGLFAAWLLLRFERLGWADWAVLLAAAVFVYKVPNSRMAALAMLAMLAAEALLKFWNRVLEYPAARLLCCLAPLLTALASLAAGTLYRQGTPLWDRLNALSSDRLRLFHLAGQSYGITLLGTPLNDPEIYALDNLFLRVLYGYGVVLALVVVGLLTLLMLRCVRLRAKPETAVLLGMTLYAACEGAAASPSYNLALLLVIGCLCGVPDGQFALLSRPAADEPGDAGA